MFEISPMSDPIFACLTYYKWCVNSKSSRTSKVAECSFFIYLGLSIGFYFQLKKMLEYRHEYFFWTPFTLKIILFVLKYNYIIFSFPFFRQLLLCISLFSLKIMASFTLLNMHNTHTHKCPHISCSSVSFTNLSGLLLGHRC